MTGAPEITVVVPTHQRRALLVRTLEALVSQSVGGDRYELAVVCDGCDDGSAEAARSAARPGGPRLEVIEQPRSGAAAARNRGAAAGSAPRLLFLDDDMIAAPDLLEVHLEPRATSADAVVLGAVGVHGDSPRSFLTEGLARWADERDRQLADASTEIPATEVLTGHLALSKKTFDSLGGFDAGFTAGGSFGGEDLDFGWRARERGIPAIYEPRAVARQLWEKSFRSLCRNIRDSGSADVRLARKHPEMASRLVLGSVDRLPPWERRALRMTLSRPRLAALAFGPALLGLDLVARLHGRGRRLEHLHAVCRAHLYALGMLDAGING